MPERRAGPLSVVFFLDNYWPHIGGVENAFKHLCEGLASRGHAVTVVTHRPRETKNTEVIGGVRIVRIPCLFSRYVFTLAAMLWVIGRRPRADVIHTTTFNAAPAAWLAGRLRGVRVVMTVNETWIGKWRANTNFSKRKALLHEILERAVFAIRYDAYVAISAATANALTNVLPHARRRTQTIYYGFDDRRWRAAVRVPTLRERLGSVDRFLIVGYGRPGTSKGFQWFVDAIPEIVRAIPNAAFVLILSDDAQYVRELADLKRRAGDRVIFLPPQTFEQLPGFIKTADCVVVPSLAEGFGYTTLEAVAAGVPVVASDVGSIPEVIGGRYRLVAAKDAQALARALREIASGGGTIAPERSFPWSVCVDRYETLYRELIAHT